MTFFQEVRREKTVEERWSSLRGRARTRGIEFPCSYDPNSAINIAGPGGMIDTTDRKFIETWRKLSGQWDPEELRHDVLYLTPYVSCAECNGLIFIDAEKVRASQCRTICNEMEIMRLTQRLEACPGCGTTVKFRLGAHDLMSEIADSKAEILRQLQKRKQAARKLGRFYRWILRKNDGRARRSFVLVARMLFDACATKIIAGSRGRLGRRKALTCICLQVIADTHPDMVKRAMKGDGWKNTPPVTEENEAHWPVPRRKVFWYKNQKQLKLLYYDYLELCKRLGFVPPRFIVESNIHEIARRIRARMHYLIGNVQARWRGISVRQLINQLIRERRRCLEVESAAGFRLTRIIRGWMARAIYIREFRAKFAINQIAISYKRERSEYLQRRAEHAAKSKLSTLFSRERAQERTARYAGLVRNQSKEHKMLAFKRSAYCGDAVDRAADEFVARVNSRIAQNTATACTLTKHRQNIIQRCQNDSDYTKYHAHQFHLVEHNTLTSITSSWSKERRSSRLAAAKAALSPKLQQKYGLIQNHGPTLSLGNSSEQQYDGHALALVEKFGDYSSPAS